MRLLLADDDRATRVLLRASLERWGYAVEEAEDGRRALDVLLGPGPPRIALLDWVMPGKDGPDVCREVAARASGPLIYLILVTSKSSKADIVAGLDSGAHDFLSKPVDAAELRSRVAVGARLVEAEDALRAASARIRPLQRLLPICGQCKSVRTDTGYWQAIESYVEEQTASGPLFSHSICPECARSLYPELYDAAGNPKEPGLP